MKINIYIGTLFLFTIFLAGASFAQDDEIRLETNLVTLNVAVTDGKGNYIRGLDKDRFVVLDNGRKQDIDIFSAVSAPLSVGVVYDMRPSDNDRTASVLEALRQFAQRLGPDDQLLVNVFGSGGNLTTDFVPTNEQVAVWVQNGGGKGPHSLYDSIFEASNRVSRMKNPKKVLIVLTDGQDHNSLHSYKELRSHLRSINLPVYSVTFSTGDRRMFSYADINRNGPRQIFAANEASEIDRSMLADISKTTGGQSFEGTIRNRYYLSALCTKVIDEINNQYIIGFYPEGRDGKWHKLTVRVADRSNGKLKISSRRGYQSRK